MSNRQFLADARETIDKPLDQVAKGMTFIASWKSAEGSDIGDNALFGLVLQNTARRTHLTLEVAGGGATETQLYELSSLGATGTAVPVYNLKRGSGISSTVNVFHTPTAPTGTLLVNFIEPFGIPFIAGGLSRRGTEWELSTGTAYFAGGVNRAGSAQPASVMAQWYEDF